jgi:hypothetical protein
MRIGRLIHELIKLPTDVDVQIFYTDKNDNVWSTSDLELDFREYDGVVYIRKEKT